MDNEHYSNIIRTLRSDASESLAKRQKIEDPAATPRGFHSTAGPINNINGLPTPNVINELNISNNTPTVYQN
ncbi:unnamed protein product [Acanthoscelides obtectus]|uniref:Uncharacterized protein n=1 Tax=Acanthoscelides obtectus TaxID=200917 RepID=A0A9P0P4J0_ACAOB|nr:unnamed protein product [Acanthoscelides obtectus]CAK1671946.1 hypothetical protein AOBTE_LOCUS28556 [Acanthoscelides obtectus]